MSSEKLGMAMRDKYWSERNTDEKIYALYMEVMQMRYQLTNVTALLEDMLTHSHADGKVVGPINLYCVVRGASDLSQRQEGDTDAEAG